MIKKNVVNYNYFIFIRLEYPKELKETLSIDTLQRLMIKFSLKDIDHNTLTKVQQAFVKLLNRETKKEATFVCLSDSNHNYKLNMVGGSSDLWYYCVRELKLELLV